MLDSDDDLFGAFDDIDETIIAAADEAESKFLESQRTVQTGRVLSEPQSPPPPKRQRLGYGWAPQPPRIVSLNSFDSLPEVSVFDNGLYDLESTRDHASRLDESVSVNLTQEHTPPISQQTQDAPVYNVPITNVQRSMTEEPEGRPRLSQQALENASQGHAPAATVNRQKEAQLEKELGALRAEFQKLREEQELVQRNLKEAEDARLAKEGEVSILRKGIQKTAQEHAAEITRIKAAKEAAEAMQTQAQKQLKEEMDRLKTQFAFKQHELETSARSSPWTVRSKKSQKQAPPTPVKMPAQMREWNAGPSNLSQGSNYPRDDPFSSQGFEVPRQKVRAVAEKPKKTLPGFVNAFDLSPPKSQPKSKGKSKEKEQSVMEREASMPGWFPAPSSQRPISPPQMHSSPVTSPPSTPTGVRGSKFQPFDRNVRVMGPPPERNVTEDPMEVDSDDQGQAVPLEESPAEETLELPFMDWRAELHRIVMTHRYPSSPTLTMHLLMSTTLYASASIEQVQTYRILNDKLLENLGTAMISGDDADSANHALLSILVGMVGILHAAAMFPPLTSLLHLLRVLALYLPTFSHFVLAPPERDDAADDDDAPQILVTLCDIIRVHVIVKDPFPDELVDLAKETLGLLEVITWTIPANLVPRLAYIPRSPDTLSTMLAPGLPTSLLAHATRLLTLLASHHSLFRHLLALPPEADSLTQSSASPNFSRLPHIEQLSAYLIDTSRKGAEADALKESILAFVASLSVAHADAITILVQSQTLIPSMVVFLTQVSTPFFEEEPSLMRSPARVESVVVLVVRTMSLLYSLVFGAGSSFNLRQKILLCPPSRQFHGIQYMLLVTLGRLSYAEPPQTLTTKLQNQLDQTLDMAKGMLELLVDGPEHEAIWAAFQVDKDEPMNSIKTEDDDEEREARIQLPVESQEV
ncbi:hypothetical protein POSPLADRAFT_1053162 [Postia placenta MAD-698-R-SB12]|uniref:Uncharacterized protein n=1 Tax=Postia placenta MAD-698-R-SB12 TaxID=670580 RepID=A0A1X6ND03_9APHY|nr:hypothetical protein POSPLADRAFT_1053162 [Postia placenta MAD-698-R-SB12]OSX66525.1 hypothetical protein POSPLADRAFT_1053162 [Postia placenta MAD-698-R-SB12]